MKRKTGERAQNRGRKGGVSMWTAGATGAAIGAALGGVAGAALANTNTRKVLQNTIDQATRAANDSMEAIRENRIVERTTKQLRGRKGGQSSKGKSQ